MEWVDKELETDLLKYVSDAKEGEYRDILAADKRYDIFLHLSPMRHSLLNWYDFRENASILEVNGEYGALTEYLCSVADTVTTLVRTKEAAHIVEKRCERFSNLKVIIGNLDALEENNRYQYVLMTEGLEYLCNGYRGTKVYSEELTKLKEFLAEDGTILLATENRYGLRYFCGERDPITKIPFAGLNRYLGGNGGGYVFSRQEIIEILTGLHGLKYKFYYPLPDYRFPQMIYTDSYLPGGNLKERLLTPTRDISTMLMDENRLYDDIAANDVFPFFSNSFLIECNFNGKFNATEYAALTTDRGKEHGFVTMIESGRVIKKALHEDGKKAVERLEKNIRKLENTGVKTVPHNISGLQILMPRIDQPTLSQVLKDTIRTDPEQYREWFRILYQEILRSSEPGIFEKSKFQNYNSEADIWGPILKTAYIDMVPINCFADQEKKELIFFDQEFVLQNAPAGYVMFRALKYTYFFMPFAKGIVSLDEMKREYHLEQAWNYYNEEEREFVADNRDYKTYGNFNKWCKRDKKQILANIERLQGE